MVKNIFRVIVILLCFTTAQCGLISEIKFTATIDGEQYQAIAGWWGNLVLDGLKSGLIVAIDEGQNTFTFNVFGEFEEKTYPLGVFGEGIATYLNSQGVLFTDQGGSLTITSKTNERLVGEFEISLVGLTETGEVVTLEVTDGEFDLPFSPEASLI